MSLSPSPLPVRSPCSLYCRYEDYERKTRRLHSQRQQLEYQVQQLEFVNRTLQYGLDQSREETKVKEAVSTQFKDQLDRLEGRLGSEVEGRQTAELRAKELEVRMRNLQLSIQQLTEEREHLKVQLQGEVETRILQEGLHQEQVHTQTKSHATGEGK